MARHTSGWIKIWRSATFGDIFSNYTRGGLFTTLISMARIESSPASWLGKPIILNRGEIVTSFTELAQKGAVDRKTVKRHLNYLVLRDTISLERSPDGILIKFKNFSQYQDIDAERSRSGPVGWDNNRDNNRDNDVPQNEELKNLRIKEGERGSPSPQKGWINSAEELKDSVPLITREQWARRYPDKAWLDQSYQDCFAYHSADPICAPKTPGQWMQKLMTWLSIGWANRERTHDSGGDYRTISELVAAGELSS